MKNLRIVVPVLALAALAAAGCILISGQFVVSYELGTYHAIGGGTLLGTAVDLNTVSEYQDHKSELKRVDDLALIGEFHNGTVVASTVEVWIVPTGQTSLSLSALQSSGVQLWGPLTIAGNATEKVDWNRSAKLFKGRQTLIDEIKGDGKFSLFVIANGAFDITLDKAAVIAVIGAAK